MTRDDVKKRVAAIAAMADDDEAAHGAEDRLWCEVLQVIADGQTTDPAGLAVEALQTLSVDFARWCA